MVNGSMSIDTKHILGLIVARGGSKRIPLKNIKPLNGIPLVGYLVRAAKDSKLLNRVIVSTDHPDIKKIAIDFGADVPFDRPEEISSDCPTEFVSQHAVEFHENQTGKKVDILVTMQPTTPFCLGTDIDRCIEMLLNNRNWESVFSGCVISQRPEWMFTLDADCSGKLFLEGVLAGERSVVQNLPTMVTPNGAVYATRRAELMERNRIISPQTGIYVMPAERSVDIDEPIDFEFAEFMAKKLGG